MRTKTLHFRAVSISRNKASPDNAVKASAYRAGMNLYDDKEKKLHRYGNRGGVIEAEIFAPENAPDWMRDDDKRRAWQRFGNEIEKAEDGHNRRNQAQLAKDFQVAAPRELSHEQNWELAQAFAKKFNERGLAVGVGFHEEDASDGGKNPHFHFMVPMRTVDENGFGKKYRPLDGKPGGHNPEFMRMRRDYYGLVNEALEKASVKGLYYDPERQDKEPRLHKGKWATALEKKGVDTRIAAHNRKVGFNNVMRPYEKAIEESEDTWAFQPPAAEKDWHQRFAEWQMQRSAAMAARDARQKSESNVTAPAATRKENNTQGVREAAKLANRQTRTWQNRTQSRSKEPELER